MRNRYLPFLLASCLIMFIAALFWRPILVYMGIVAPLDRINTTFALNQLHYDSQHDKDPGIYAINTQQGEHITHISFEFKIDQNQKYTDILQIAQKFQGIHFAARKGGDAAVFVGANNRRGYAIIKISQPVTLRDWHRLDILAWQGHMVRVAMDNLPARYFGHDYIGSDINYKLDKLYVGGGYEGLHNLQGAIRQLQITDQIIDPGWRKTVDQVAHYLQYGFGILTLLCLFGVTTKPLTREIKIEWLCSIILIGFVVAVIFHYIAAGYAHAGYPYNTFLLKGDGNEFSDFYIYRMTDHSLNPYFSTFLRGDYFPFSYVLLYPFVLINANVGLVIFLLIYIIGMVIFVKNNFTIPLKNSGMRVVNYKNIFIISILTYPFLFSFERANLENIMFLLIALSLYYFEKNRNKLAAILLGVAGATKLYPLLLIMYFISERRYRAVPYALLSFAGITLISLSILHPGFWQNLYALKDLLFKRNEDCALMPFVCMQHSVGIWGVIKFNIYQITSTVGQLLAAIKIYQAEGLFILGIMLLYIFFIETIRWRKLAILVCAISLLPIISANYKMLYLYLPLAGFINDRPRPLDGWYLGLFASLMIPKSYYLAQSCMRLDIADILNPALLVLLVLTIMVDGICRAFYAQRANKLAPDLTMGLAFKD